MYDTNFEKRGSRAFKRGIMCADTMIIKGMTVNQRLNILSFQNSAKFGIKCMTPFLKRGDQELSNEVSCVQIK